MIRLVNTVYWLALVAWFAALFAGAATATSAFTALPALGVVVPSADQVYPGATPEAARFAAGFVAQPVFNTLDRVALLAMPTLAITMLLQRSAFAWPSRSWANRGRIAVIAAAIVVGTLHLALLAPRMNTTLADYRAAVLQGDAQAAAEHKTSFDRDHKKSEPMLGTAGMLLVVGIALSAWTFTPRRAGQRGEIQAPRMLGRS
ncbi:MAG: hypothetical protein U0572_12430 [Phycisphaerales bacterium]